MRSYCPRPGHAGISGRGVYSGPGLADVDASLFKTTAITERTNLQFRAEFFNVLQPRQFRDAERHGIFERRHQPSAGLITTHGHHIAADPIRAKADFLIP